MFLTTPNLIRICTSNFKVFSYIFDMENSCEWYEVAYWVIDLYHSLSYSIYLKFRQKVYCEFSETYIYINI